MDRPRGASVDLSSTSTINGDAVRQRSASAAQLNGSQSSGADDIVPVGFDEGVLRQLMDLDCGLPLMLDRIKQDMTACREIASFLRRRAQLEDDYGRNSVKLARSAQEAYRDSDGKAGSFVTAFTAALRSHELLGENRMRFAQQLVEMADQLGELQRESDRARKANKELGARLEKTLADSESSTEKARMRFDAAHDELEKVLVMKAGESSRDSANTPFIASHATLSSSPTQSFATSSGGIGSAPSSSSSTSKQRTFGKAMSRIKLSGSSTPRNPAQLARLEEEARARCARESDAYAKESAATSEHRSNHFRREMPRVLRALKESADEIDLGTQYHLARYAHLYEHVLVQDGLLVSPVGSVDDPGSPGLKALVEAIDNREDFRVFVSNYAVAYAQSGIKPLRREDDTSPAFVQSGKMRRNSSSGPSSSSQDRRTFGIDLAQQMARDAVDVPTVLVNCSAAIEAHGLENMGIYRLSGTTSRIQRLKGKLDRDPNGVDLLSEENLQDINDITGVLKLWFRELPDPLMTYDLYHGFVDAAKIENDRLRHIRLHERVNELPDANYATLKHLMGHLAKVADNGEVNQMRASNLAIVFGPTLFRPPPDQQGAALSDMTWQCRAIETILQNNDAIFTLNDDEDDVPPSTAPGPAAPATSPDTA